MDNTDNIFDINAFLRKAVEEGVSDVHLRIDEVPVVRKDGKIIKTNFPQITEKDISHVLNVVLPKYLRTKVQAAFDLDFSYEIKGLSRFRINLARQMGNTSLVFRIIPYEIPTFEQLHLPLSQSKTRLSLSIPTKTVSLPKDRWKSIRFLSLTG